MKAVLDTNVLVSAALSGAAPPAAVLRAWRDGRFQAVTSPSLIDELRRVLARPRIVESLGWSPEERRFFITAIEENATAVAPASELQVIAEDLADNRVLEAAPAGRADYIVSGDHHLFDLDTHAGIPIVTPARFLVALALG